MMWLFWQIQSGPDVQYFNISAIIDGNGELTYINTETNQLMYNPVVYNGNWDSNLSGKCECVHENA